MVDELQGLSPARVPTGVRIQTTETAKSLASAVSNSETGPGNLISRLLELKAIDESSITIGPENIDQKFTLSRAAALNLSSAHKDPRILNTGNIADSTFLMSEDPNNNLLGRGISGQHCYDVNPTSDPELYKWHKATWEAGLEEGLDPFPIQYWVYDRDYLMQAAARTGFPVNLPHWKFGQEFRELQLGHEYGNQRIYEMIVNTNPSVAYLMKSNPTYDQKLVMAHCMGHSDFFKNNIWFGNTNRDMMNRIKEQRKYVDKLMLEDGVSYDEIEDFLDMAFSIDDLIDKTNPSPREINYELMQTKEAEPLPDDYSVIDTTGIPDHMARRINNPERIEAERKTEKKKREAEVRKTPRNPDRDVLAYLIENSKVLKPWQRTLLGFVREQSYYLAPQGMTKIMNEGWAVYWHQKLLCRPDIIDLGHATDIADHNAGTLAMSGGRINPYTVGVAIFRDIERRWNKGQHGDAWENIENRKARREYDDKSMKGKEKIFEVRRLYKDVQFIDTFLTPELCEELKLFQFKDDGSGMYRISSREFQTIKDQLIDMLQNGGRPIIDVRNGNHQNNDELLLKHNFSYELDVEEAKYTLKNLLKLWGKTVHLDTEMYHENNITPVRISAQNDNGKVKIVIRKTTKDGENYKLVDGKPLKEEVL